MLLFFTPAALTDYSLCVWVKNVFLFIKNNSCCYLCPEDGRILRAYLFSHWIPAVPSAAVVVPNHREGEPEGIESPKPQA